MSNVYKLPVNPRTELTCPLCEGNNWTICVTRFELEPAVNSADVECMSEGCEFVVGLLLVIPEDDEE